MILAIMTSCNKNESGYEQDGDREIRENLQNMVALVLADYKQKVPDYPGGLALKVISERGSFFVSADMGSSAIYALNT